MTKEAILNLAIVNELHPGPVPPIGGPNQRLISDENSQPLWENIPEGGAGAPAGTLNSMQRKSSGTEFGETSWIALDVGTGVYAGLTCSNDSGFFAIGAGAKPTTGIIRVGYKSVASGGVVLMTARTEADATVQLMTWNEVANAWRFGNTGVDHYYMRHSAGGDFNLIYNGVVAHAFTATAYSSTGQISGAALISTGVSHFQHARMTGVISPAQITANQNDYAPTGLATAAVIRVSSDAVRRITGLDSTGLSAGPLRTIVNVGSHPIVLSNADTGSATNNRFNLGSHDVVLAPDQAITLWLDVSGPNRWRPIGVAEQYTPTHGVTLADADATLTADQGAVRRIPVISANRTYDIDNTNAIDEEIVVLVRDGAEAFTATIRDHADATIATFPASQKLAGSFKKKTGENFEFLGFQRVN